MTNTNLGKNTIELGKDFVPYFNAEGLLPVIVQDNTTKMVIMFAYMNAQSLRMTLECGEMIYYSRSRSELWHKGKTSGSVQKVIRMAVDCDQDVILAFVEPEQAGACHNGYETCFYRDVDTNGVHVSFNDVVRCFDPKQVYGK